MSNSNGVISTPINIETDIYKVMGLTKTSSGYDLGYSCGNTHGKINRWSKIKPQSINSPSVHLKNDKITIYNPFTGSSQTVPAYFGDVKSTTATIGGQSVTIYYFCGIGIPVIYNMTINNTQLPKIIDALESSGYNWPYSPPTSNFRALDFDGYDHNAQCPISYSVREKVYNGQYPSFGFYYVSESQNQIDIQEFGDFFNNFKTYILVCTSAGSVMETIELGLMSGGIDEFVTSTKKYNTGNYKAYFFAYNSSSQTIMLFPSLPNYKNPMAFQVLSTGDPSDITTNPFGSLTFNLFDDDSGFAYNRISTFYESFTNVNENEFVVLNTTDQYCIKMTVKNNKSVNIYVDLSKFRCIWAEFGSNRGDFYGGMYAEMGFNLYIDDVAQQKTGRFLFNAGSTHVLKFQLNNIYYDTYGGIQLNPSQGEEYGNIDPAAILYNDLIIASYDMIVKYDSSHNSYFYSSSRGYYKTR